MHKPKHNQKKRTRIQPEGIDDIKSRIWHKMFILHEDYIPKNQREEKIKQEFINEINSN